MNLRERIPALLIKSLTSLSHVPDKWQRKATVDGSTINRDDLKTEVKPDIPVQIGKFKIRH
jgi:hypothetical protein